MTRTKRAIAIGLMVTVTGFLVGPSAKAEPSPLCYSNLAYRSMHEECEKQAPIDHQGHPTGGGLGGLIHRLSGGLL